MDLCLIGRIRLVVGPVSYIGGGSGSSAISGAADQPVSGVRIAVS
jgi:hypothetical protein